MYKDKKKFQKKICLSLYFLQKDNSPHSVRLPILIAPSCTYLKSGFVLNEVLVLCRQHTALAALRLPGLGALGSHTPSHCWAHPALKRTEASPKIPLLHECSFGVMWETLWLALHLAWLHGGSACRHPWRRVRPERSRSTPPFRSMEASGQTISYVEECHHSQLLRTG